MGRLLPSVALHGLPSRDPVPSVHVLRPRPDAAATVVGVTPTRTRLLRSASALLLASGLVGGLAACSEGGAVDDIVGSAVDQGVESVRGTVEEAVGDALGGASVSTDGTLPESFPAEVPLLDGTVRGGGAGPDGSGWVAQLAVTSLDDFTTARSELETAGYAAAGVDVGADTALGTFTGPTYRVVLTVTTQASDSAVLATYVVTPV